MMQQGIIVTHNDFSKSLDYGAGLVVGHVEGEPDCVWVRWNGEKEQSKEHVAELRCA